MRDVKLIAKEAMKKILDGTYTLVPDRGTLRNRDNGSSTINSQEDRLFWNKNYIGNLFGILRLSIARVYDLRVNSVDDLIQISDQISRQFKCDFEFIQDHVVGHTVLEFNGLSYEERLKLALQRMCVYGLEFNKVVI